MAGVMASTGGHDGEMFADEVADEVIDDGLALGEPSNSWSESAFVRAVRCRAPRGGTVACRGGHRLVRSSTSPWSLLEVVVRLYHDFGGLREFYKRHGTGALSPWHSLETTTMAATLRTAGGHLLICKLSSPMRQGPGGPRASRRRRPTSRRRLPARKDEHRQ